MIAQALINLGYSDCQWRISGEEIYENLIWDDGRPAPTQTEIKTEVKRLQEVWDSQAYARARKAEYDALNQFELISDDTNNGTTTHIDAVNAIKTKYPKP